MRNAQGVDPSTPSSQEVETEVWRFGRRCRHPKTPATPGMTLLKGHGKTLNENNHK